MLLLLGDLLLQLCELLLLEAELARRLRHCRLLLVAGLRQVVHLRGEAAQLSALVRELGLVLHRPPLQLLPPVPALARLLLLRLLALALLLLAFLALALRHCLCWWGTGRLGSRLGSRRPLGSICWASLSRPVPALVFFYCLVAKGKGLVQLVCWTRQRQAALARPLVARPHTARHMACLSAAIRVPSTSIGPMWANEAVFAAPLPSASLLLEAEGSSLTGWSPPSMATQSGGLQCSFACLRDCGCQCACVFACMLFACACVRACVRVCTCVSVCVGAQVQVCIGVDVQVCAWVLHPCHGQASRQHTG